MDHDVLVVLAQHPPGLREGAALVDQAVVGLQEGHMQLGDDRVLVVAGVADQGGPVVREVGAARLARQVVVVALAGGRANGGLGPLSSVTLPISIRLRLAGSRGAGGP